MKEKIGKYFSIDQINNRESSEETILNLLEETCNKLNIASSNV